MKYAVTLGGCWAVISDSGKDPVQMIRKALKVLPRSEDELFHFTAEGLYETWMNEPEVFDGMAPDATDFDDFTRKAGYILIPEYGIYIHKSTFTAYVVPPNVKEGLVSNLSDLHFVRYRGVRA